MYIKLKKSARNYLRSFRMTMLFSQSDRLVLLDCTISGIKEGQLCGQSCFNIYMNQIEIVIDKTRSRENRAGRAKVPARGQCSAFLAASCF